MESAEVARQACLDLCIEDSALALVTRDSCLNSCENAWLEWPVLLNRLANSPAECERLLTDGVANSHADLRTLIHDECELAQTSEHARIGCRRAWQSFVTALDPASACGKQPSSPASPAAPQNREIQTATTPFSTAFYPDGADVGGQKPPEDLIVLPSRPDATETALSPKADGVSKPARIGEQLQESASKPMFEGPEETKEPVNANPKSIPEICDTPKYSKVAPRKKELKDRPAGLISSPMAKISKKEQLPSGPRPEATDRSLQEGQTQADTTSSSAPAAGKAPQAQEPKREQGKEPDKPATSPATSRALPLSNNVPGSGAGSLTPAEKNKQQPEPSKAEESPPLSVSPLREEPGKTEAASRAPSVQVPAASPGHSSASTSQVLPPPRLPMPEGEQNQPEAAPPVRRATPPVPSILHAPYKAPIILSPSINLGQDGNEKP